MGDSASAKAENDLETLALCDFLPFTVGIQWRFWLGGPPEFMRTKIVDTFIVNGFQF